MILLELFHKKKPFRVVLKSKCCVSEIPNLTNELFYFFIILMLSGSGNFAVNFRFSVRTEVLCSLMRYKRNKVAFGQRHYN